jgi:hypothetical protein
VVKRGSRNMLDAGLGADGTDGDEDEDEDGGFEVRRRCEGGMRLDDDDDDDDDDDEDSGVASFDAADDKGTDGNAASLPPSSPEDNSLSNLRLMSMKHK